MRIKQTPLSLAERINLAKTKKRKGFIIAPAVNPSAKDFYAFRADLYKVVEQAENLIREKLLPVLEARKAEFVRDGILSFDISRILSVISNTLDLENSPEAIAAAAVTRQADTNIRRFNNAVFKQNGVSLANILTTENLIEGMSARIVENAALIKSINQEQLKKISVAVYRGMTEGDTPFSLAQEIRKINKSTYRRAELIARDQLQKTNAYITQTRQEALGVEEYVWSTSQDERVRESHKKKNGKVFRWDSPPADTGHPGADINCRCVARAVIKL